MTVNNPRNDSNRDFRITHNGNIATVKGMNAVMNLVEKLNPGEELISETEGICPVVLRKQDATTIIVIGYDDRNGMTTDTAKHKISKSGVIEECSEILAKARAQKRRRADCRR